MRASALVAWNLRRLRVKRGLSQEALAADASVDRSYVGRLERGLENPTTNLFERLATILEVRLIELFVMPARNERPPTPLPGGRRRRRTGTRASAQNVS